MRTLIAIRVMIEGRVQGVWYRGWTVEQANTRNLSGWVRNRRDGSVEALFIGPELEVHAMIESCRCGPPAAEVLSIKAEITEMVECAGFRQLPTI